MHGQVHVEERPVIVAGVHAVDAFAYGNDLYMSSSEEDLDADEVFPEAPDSAADDDGVADEAMADETNVSQGDASRPDQNTGPKA